MSARNTVISGFKINRIDLKNFPKNVLETAEFYLRQLSIVGLTAILRLLQGKISIFLQS